MEYKKEELVSTIRDRIIKNIDLSNVKDDDLRGIIEREMFVCIGKNYVSLSDKGYIIRSVFNAIRGNGILDNILEDDEITEVMINGFDRIFIEKNGSIIRYPGSFESDERLRDIIQKIVGNTGREVNNSNPIVDTRLEDGSRVNIILPPLALCGPTMTIRKFSKEPMTMERLISYGSVTPEIAAVLKVLVEAKYNIFICGGTGSGKTTFLNALSNYIPSNERIITIEDSAELQIRNIDNLVSLETRNSNTSGKGEVTIRELIKNALRMRPERIIVGEVRGAEALDMLQAMNTGHDGSLSTGHANSSRDMMFRLETMVLQGAANLPLDAIRQQIGSAIDIVIHLSRLRDRTRRVMEIAEVCGCENGQVVLKPLYVFRENTDLSTKEKVVGELVRTSHRLENDFKLRLAGLDDDELLQER
jgi:pilus assembly protein CpaF